MASNTPNLNLLKKDPVTDGNDTFNVRTMLNENWDKIDAAVGDMDIPEASLTVKGKVQLSSVTDSSSEDKAATPKAVKDVALEAKSYTDQQINLVTETGIPKLVSYPLKVTATANNQTVFEIPLDLFDANTDTLLVAINRATLDSTQYTVTNSVRNGAGEVTQRAKITLISGIAATSEVTMVVLKNVPLGEEGAINGAVLAVDSVPINRVNGLQGQLDELFQSGNSGKSSLEATIIAAKGTVSKAGSVATFGELKSAIPTIFTGNTADATADAGQILSGYTAYKNGKKITGAIVNQGAKLSTLTAQDQQYIIPAGFHNGNGKVTTTFANLVPGNIKSGVDIGGVVGVLEQKVAGTAEVSFNRGSDEPTTVNRTIVDILTLPKGISYFRYLSLDSSTNYLRSYISNTSDRAWSVVTLSLIDSKGTILDVTSAIQGGTTNIYEILIVFKEGVILVKRNKGYPFDEGTQSSSVAIKNLVEPFRLAYTYSMNVGGYSAYTYVLFRGNVTYS